MAWVAFSRAVAAERDPAGPADVGGLLAPIFGEADVPGGVALALRGDRVIAQGVVGVRQRGGADRVTLADQFHLGSCTKAMTATLVALAVEEGRLKWTSTLAEIFGDVVSDLHPDWKHATLRMVLAHRAGLPANLGRLTTVRFSFSSDPPSRQRARIAADILGDPPVHPPGKAFLYSNVGYTLAGAALEHLAGRAWEELMRERLFRPLGITTGGFGAPGAVKADQPWGHRGAGMKPVDPRGSADNIPAIGPAGTAHMTIGDWAKFVTLHLRGHAANPQRVMRLLGESAFAQLHTPAAGERYAGGWGVQTRGWAKGGRVPDSGVTLTHAGSNTMWFCVTWLAPEIDFAVLVACNAAGDPVARACDKAAGELIRRFARA